MINRPDLCAPGALSIYTYPGTEKAYTSFATPHVTGTVIQMISRNAGMADKQTVLKAALIASATYGTASRGIILILKSQK